MILKLLEYISKQLDEKNIPYMLSGSLALNTYTIPRMTRDIDIVIHLQKNDVERFLSIFKDNFYFNKQVIIQEIDRKGMFNLIDNNSGYKVDFIIRKDSEYRKLEFNRRKRTSVLGFDTWIVSLEDLIISKLDWIQQFQSDKQIDDIKNLLEHPKCDKIYIQTWCKKLNLKTFNLI